ncbi:c-type cytochrome [Hwanghaeella sp.]|uniref:c-type cytochrome n=1 Tax=Hwanghaeella sp. TaxID=2605943 RepID=UPI003CCBB846
MRFLPLAVFVVAAAAIGGTMLYRTGQQEEGVQTAATPDRIAQGKAVYADHCAACHGVNLEGQPNWRSRKPDGRLPAPPHDPSGHTWHHPDEMLFVMTKFGPQATAGPGYQSDMPAFEGVLSDQEIIDVLNYIKSTWPDEIREEQARRTEVSRRNSS